MAFLNAPILFGARGSALRKTSPRCARVIPTAAAAPMGDRIFIRVDENASKTAGGLFLGSASQTRPKTGVVVGVGPGRFSPEGQVETIALDVGDHVVWRDDFGVETIDAKLTDGDGELLAMKAFNIVAKW